MYCRSCCRKKSRWLLVVAGLKSEVWQLADRPDGHWRSGFPTAFSQPPCLSVMEGGGGLHRPIWSHTWGENPPTIAISLDEATSSQHQIQCN